MSNKMLDIIAKNGGLYCLDCGKCTPVCPIVTRESQGYSNPRRLVENALNPQSHHIFNDALFWNCLTCQRCSQYCPSDVHFSEFIRDARSLVRTETCKGTCTHNDAIQTWVRIMAYSDSQQNRLGWMDENLLVSDSSDTILFIGCLPYYDVLFKSQEVEYICIARSALKILNRIGIAPQVLADERCCGHDQLWEGEVVTFRALAERNMQSFKSSGAKRIVTICPECARTLKVDYPEIVGPHGMEVMLLIELLENNLFKSLIAPSETRKNEIVTYHDPCRMGRYLQIYDRPRNILSTLGYQNREMIHSHNASLCCGSSCWTSCGQVSKNIQVDRLKEARSTGATTLVTSCVKCQIHLRCAQKDPILKDEIGIDIVDLITLIGENII